MNLDFSNKVVLITGGTTGIGLATARMFLDAGAKVLITGRSETKGENALSQLGVSNDRAGFYATDVSRVNGCRRGVEQVVQRFGKLHVVVNSAGVFRANPIENVSEAEYDWIMDTNIKGTFFTCQFAVPELLKSGGGAIVNVSSDAGLQGNKLSTAYCASKGAVTVFSKALAVDLAPRNIRVNCVCPGDIVTPMLENDLAREKDPEQYLKDLTAPYPVGRLGTPEEVASVICFLASSASLFTTGAAWSVDGGITSY